eukprot:PhF_6_TR27961/c3_g1_i1/m.41296/K14802/DRS2, ATP8A; phospholipid-transporting ATPase
MTQIAPEPPKKFVDVALYDQPFNQAQGFPTNFIKTSKYTIITFLPMNLYEQFRRVSNAFFLLNMIIALIPGVSPISPFTAVFPLLFVLGVAAFKDGYEDFVRHRLDAKANARLTSVIRDGKLVDVPSKDVQAGDIMFIQQGEEIRADVVVLSSVLPEGTAYMDTCNLDGETNIKSRRAHEVTWEMTTVESLCAAKGLVVHCEAPSTDLVSWLATMNYNGQEYALNENQLMFRSSVLRNTEWVYAMVVYAGVDTKMQMNTKQKPPKMSNLDHKLNRLIVIVLIVQHVFLFSMCTYSVVFYELYEKNFWFLGSLRDDDANGGANFGLHYLTYFILMSYLIPISLFVTIELCKVAQAQFMEWDDQMSDIVGGNKCFCKANTSNLNEQLSQVKYIFTDKTGTLTENLMNFAQGQVLGHFHNELVNPGNLKKLLEDNKTSNTAAAATPATSNGSNASNDSIVTNDLRSHIDLYIRSLALCHTVQPFHDKHNPGKYIYEGQSPDEAALVLTAARNGYELIARTTRSMTLKHMHDRNLEYDIMAVLEFTAERKMMSVIVRDCETGKLLLITKGADTSVLPRLRNVAHNNDVLRETKASLIRMASSGLRTLVIGAREIPESEFAEWKVNFVEAGRSMGDRKKVVDEVCLQIEKELLLVGCTAIEDKLQDKVPETLQFLLRCGIIVWMLTGDKRETAVTIAGTSQLCNPQHDHIVHIDVAETKDIEVCGNQLRDALAAAKAAASSLGTHPPVTIIIDGVTLDIALLHYNSLFIELSQLVSAAVCCRLTPSQKANIVRQFQQQTGATALAVGDGANDVSMIQEGRVGVGIIGMEGAQAALAADYAIPRFKHLKRLLAVHGRFSLYRNAFCIGFSFYKNICLSLVQFYFCFYCGGSGQTFFDGWILSFFNFAFVSVPPLFVGMFDKDVTDHVAETSPEIYPPLREGLYFDAKALGAWVASAVFHSIVLFFFTHTTRRDDDLTSAHTTDLQMQGTLVIICLVFLVLSKIALHIKMWTIILVAGMIFSYVIFLCFLIGYNSILLVVDDSSFYFQINNMFTTTRPYLYLVFYVFGLVTVVDVGALYMKRKYVPTVRDLANAREKRGNLENHITSDEDNNNNNNATKKKP